MIRPLPLFRGNPVVGTVTAEDEPTDVWETSNDHRTIIKSIFISNNASSGAKKYSIKIVPNLDSPDTTDWIFKDRSLSNASSDNHVVNLALEAGDRIQVMGEGGIYMYITGIDTDQ